MATIGLELCDAGFEAVMCAGGTLQPITGSSPGAIGDWPGFAYHDGQRFTYGRAAEDQWFVHPRRVAHTFWSRLAHEPSTLGPAGRLAPLSELAFNFFREFQQRVATAAAGDKFVLAVPGAYLKDPATEEEKIGLLLGIASELTLPLAGIVDLAGAALCDPRSAGFNPALPVLVVDLHLEGAELTLFATEAHLERKDYLHLPQAGYAQLLKQLTGTMGNRFLRHTAFDILEDGRIEQLFFRQTKDFLYSNAAEHRFQINTANRGYEMLAKRDQLAADAQIFVGTLVTAIQTFLRNTAEPAEPCTVALSDRAARLPGLEAKLRAAGYLRLLRLPAGAGAAGAAHIGESRLKPAQDLADVPVETSLPLALAHRFAAALWEVRLLKDRAGASRRIPTHAIIDGVGVELGHAPRFTIGIAALAVDLVLPETFHRAEDCAVPLARDGGRLWFTDPTLPRSGPPTAAQAVRTAIEAGDRLVIRCGDATREILFAHIKSPDSGRAGS